MRKICSICLLIVTLLVVSCSDSDVTDNSEPVETGQFTKTLSFDNENREYIIYIPESYDGKSEIPLVFNFHGFGGYIDKHIGDADMRATAESEGFILVYPQGTEIDGFSHWNAALDSPDNKSDADDLGFIDALVSKIKDDYNVDSERVYACGYSNDGMMSFALGCYKSNLFAAIGSVSGTMLDMDYTPTHPVPVIILHGTSDKVLPFNGSKDYNSIPSIIDYWNTFNNTNETPIEKSATNKGMTIEHSQYTNGDNGASVDLYKYIGGDHVWSIIAMRAKTLVNYYGDFSRNMILMDLELYPELINRIV